MAKHAEHNAAGYGNWAPITGTPPTPWALDIAKPTAGRDDGTPKRAALGPLLELPPEKLDERLPYDGLRGTVRRSQVAKTGLIVGRTEEDNGRPRPIGFESRLERAVAIACLLHPKTTGLKCQARTVHFDAPVNGVKSNTLDFLLTQRSDAPTYLFVKNDAAIADRPDSRANPQTSALAGHLLGGKNLAPRFVRSRDRYPRANAFGPGRLS